MAKSPKRVRSGLQEERAETGTLYTTHCGGRREDFFVANFPPPENPDVPVTALLYDNVNAVYRKMYFLWKL